MTIPSNQEQLFLRFINGDCTSDELRYLAIHYTEKEQKEIIERLLSKRWKQGSKNPDPEIYQRILSGVHKRIIQEKPIPKPNNIDYLYFTKVAATFLIIVSTIAFFATDFFSMQEESTPSATVRMITKSTSFGQKLKVTLPDNSLAILNYGTTISYPEHFSDSFRIVNLSGEAYFEIASDTQRPFITKGDKIEVSVLGTKFNFNTRNSEVALSEGSVKLKADKEETLLSPGQLANYSTSKHSFITSEINQVQQFGWKEGVIYIEGMNLQHLITSLERWYGVEIEAAGLNLKKEFRGTLSNRSLENILEGICFTINCQYKINNHEVKLYY